MTPEGWEERMLGDVARVVGGFGFPKKYQGHSDLPHPFFKVSDMNAPKNSRWLRQANNYVDDELLEKMKAKLYPEGTIVFPKVGAALLTNKRRLLGVKGLFDNNVMGLIPHSVRGDYLFCVMQTVDFANMVQAGAVPSVNGTMVKALSLALPPLPEQHKIAAILSSVDEVIEKTEAVIEPLEVLKKAMMQELLTRGLPGRHTRFKQTEIGEVPEEWEVVTLDGCVRERIRNGYSPVCPKTPTGKWTLGLGAVGFSGFDPEGAKPAPPDDPKVNGTQLEHGDLLLSRSNTRERVGLVGIYRGDPAPCSYPDLLMRIRPNKRTTSEFLEATLLSSRGRAYFESSARGTSGSMVKVNRGIVEHFPVALPQKEEQDAIVRASTTFESRRQSEAEVLSSLRSLKKSLLSVLLTGEVRVTPDEEPT